MTVKSPYILSESVTRSECPQLSHEVLPAAGDVRQVPRRPQRHFHRLLHHGVRLQAGGLQVQGEYYKRKKATTIIAQLSSL